MAKPAIEVEGLRELSKALRELDKQTARELTKEFKKVAETVAEDARGRVPVFTGANPRATPGKARASIKAGSSSQSAFIRAGKDVPYYRWLDFGSRNPRSGRPRSVGPWKGSGKGPTGGRFLYPAIDEHRGEIEDAAREAVNDAARKLGFH